MMGYLMQVILCAAFDWILRYDIVLVMATDFQMACASNLFGAPSEFLLDNKQCQH